MTSVDSTTLFCAASVIATGVFELYSAPTTLEITRGPVTMIGKLPVAGGFVTGAGDGSRDTGALALNDRGVKNTSCEFCVAGLNRDAPGSLVVPLAFWSMKLPFMTVAPESHRTRSRITGPTA